MNSLSKELREISDEELIEKSGSYIGQLAKTYGKSHKMSIPPDKYDTDMLLGELRRRYKALLEHLEKQTEIMSQFVSSDSEMATKYAEFIGLDIEPMVKENVEMIRELIKKGKSE